MNPLRLICIRRRDVDIRTAYKRSRIRASTDSRECCADLHVTDMNPAIIDFESSTKEEPLEHEYGARLSDPQNSIMTPTATDGSGGYYGQVLCSSKRRRRIR